MCTCDEDRRLVRALLCMGLAGCTVPVHSVLTISLFGDIPRLVTTTLVLEPTIVRQMHLNGLPHSVAVPLAGMLALGQSKGNDCGLKNITQQSDRFDRYFQDPTSVDCFHSGGGGLTGTCADYVRFAQCMLNGGQLDGHRILGRKAVQMMTQNQLGWQASTGRPKGVAEMTPELFAEYSEASSDSGFGLGFSVVLQPEAAAHMTSAGEFSWGGAASTAFWCDPQEGLVVVFATQLRFRDDYKLPLNSLLHNLVYACLTDGTASQTSRSRL